MKCNVALLLFIFLSALFSNLAEARDLSNQEKVLFLADFECVADSTSEYDSDDDNVGITYDVTENDGIVHSNLFIQSKTTYDLNHAYLRPFTRAPPIYFI